MVPDGPEVVELGVGERGSDRVKFRAADLFGSRDVAGDAVILARIPHDWDDAPALRLLRNTHGALHRRADVRERDDPAGGRPAGTLCDLHLLAVTGGRDRTRSEHAALLELARFAFVARRLPGVPAVIAGEARRGSEVYGPQPVISKESRAVRS